MIVIDTDIIKKYINDNTVKKVVYDGKSLKSLVIDGTQIWYPCYKGHTVVTDAAVAATCTTTGKTEGSHCSVCNTVLVAQTTTAALGHSYKSVVTAPTCTAKGYTTYTCSTCGNSYKDNYIAALGHNYGDWTVTLAPTCTATGTKRRDCTRCTHYETETVAATGHTSVSYPNVAATCTTSGFKGGTYCSVCNAVLTARTVVAALGHSWNTPTYSWNGYSSCTATRTCKNNTSHKETATATITNAVTTAATCTTAGTRTYTATFSESWASNQTKTQSIAATGHSYTTSYSWSGYTSCTATRTCSTCGNSETATATITNDGASATCTSSAIRTYTATFSGASWASTQTKTRTMTATGHSYTSVVTAPTCTAQGYTTYTCSVCGDTYKDNYTAAKGHTWVAATCTAPKTCSVCKATEGNALGHSYGDWSVTLEPTCTTTGTKRRDCSRCDHYETGTVAKLGHNYIGTVTKPTCTVGGFTTYKCSRCGDTYKGDTTSATGHTWVAANCTTPKTCSVCGATEGSALGHTSSDWIIDVAATYDSSGSKHKECTVCGAVLETATIEKLTVEAPQIALSLYDNYKVDCNMSNPNSIELVANVTIRFVYTTDEILTRTYTFPANATQGFLWTSSNVFYSCTVTAYFEGYDDKVTTISVEGTAVEVETTTT